MSRVAKMPVKLPAGIQVSASAGLLTVKSAKTTLNVVVPPAVSIDINGDVVTVSADSVAANGMQAGTFRALLNNAVVGVSKGYERKLQLVGVGYRAAMQGKDLSLSLGFSHPTVYVAPEGITLSTPTQTEILVSGADKQQVGEVAAKIRAYRKPEPYKGKGIRYSGEKIIMKEAKKA